MRTAQAGRAVRGIFPLLILAGCQAAPPVDGNGADGASATMASQPSGNVGIGNAADARPVAVKAGAIEHDNALYSFAYKWPAEAAAIAPLNSWFLGNARKIEADLKQESQGDRDGAKGDGYDYREHSYQEDYDVIANTPQLLVLLSDGYAFSGGAHGFPVNTAIIWDRAAARRLAISALFDMPKLFARLRPRFCSALDDEREARRGAPVDPDADDAIPEFNSCPDISKQLIFPRSSGGKLLDSIEILLPPYEAGPYSEGSYEIKLAMTPDLLAAVKPGYRAAFLTQ